MERGNIRPLKTTTPGTKAELLLIARLLEALIAQLQSIPRQLVGEMIARAKEEYNGK